MEEPDGGVQQRQFAGRDFGGTGRRELLLERRWRLAMVLTDGLFRNSRASAAGFSLLIMVILCSIWLEGQYSKSDCASCKVWNMPQEPFKIFGNTYYVGTHGLSAILITSPTGHVLIDGGLPESAA